MAAGYGCSVMAMAGVPHGVHVICKFKPVLAVEGDCEKGGWGSNEETCLHLRATFIRDRNSGTKSTYT
jgi:hypothetical protein